ncbi:MAG: hypothetical protein AAF335_05090, partial [Bacteroidota bacterium]
MLKSLIISLLLIFPRYFDAGSPSELAPVKPGEYFFRRVTQIQPQMVHQLEIAVCRYLSKER